MLSHRLAALAAGPDDPSEERLSKRAYTAIRRALKAGELRPGEKLILRPLAAKLGLSATPVREALLRLVSEQAVSLDGRSSVLVPMIGTEELEELRELRLDLEGRAAEVAARRSTGQQVAALELMHDAYRSAVAARDQRALLEADDDFHAFVLTCSNRVMLLRMVDTLQVRLGPLLALAAMPEPVGEDHPHARLIDAFVRRDGDAAREAMVDDLEALFARVAQHIRTGGAHQAIPRVA